MKHTNSPRWVIYAPHVNHPSSLKIEELETLDLNEIAREVYHDFALEARNKKIQLYMNIEDQSFFLNASNNAPFEFQGNREAVYTMLSQLVRNAIAQTLEGSIEIIIDADSDQLIVEVSDTGIGILPDQKISTVETRYRGQLCKIRYVQDPSTSLTSIGDQLHRCQAMLEIQVNEGTGMKRRLFMPKFINTFETVAARPELALI